VWAGYRGDSTAQLCHLLDAGDAPSAHALFCARVAPGLFLDPSPVSMAELSRLAGRLAEAQAAIGPAWAAGAGPYHTWCRLFVAAGSGSGQGGDWRRDVVAEAVAAGGGALSAVAEAACQLAQQVVAAGHVAGGGGGAADLGDGAGGPARRAVLARMSADAGRALARVGAAQAAGGSELPAATSAAMLLQQGCATLSAHQPVLLAGLAVL
jgi:hypothetical protein